MNTTDFFHSLFSTNVTTQNEALEYFSALSLIEKQTITAEFEEFVEGDTHRFQRPNLYLPDLDEGTYEGRCLHIDWMLATAQDPRWINASHLHIKHAVVAKNFTQAHAQELFAHLLLHRNLQTLNLMNMPTDGMELLKLLRSQASATTAEEWVKVFSNMTDLNTKFAFHPFLQICGVKNLTLTGENDTYLSPFSKEYDPRTGFWYSHYWHQLIDLDTKVFPNLQSLQISNSANLFTLVNGGNNVQSLSLYDNDDVQSVYSTSNIERVDIQNCSNLETIKIPKPEWMSLQPALKHGLGNAIFPETLDEDFARFVDTETILLMKSFVERRYNNFFENTGVENIELSVNPEWFLSQLKALIAKDPVVQLKSSRASIRYFSEEFDGKILSEDIDESYFDLHIQANSFEHSDYGSGANVLFDVAPAVESTPESKKIQEAVYNWLSVTSHKELQAFVAPNLAIGDSDYSKILQSIKPSVLSAWWSTVEPFLNPTTT